MAPSEPSVILQDFDLTPPFFPGLLKPPWEIKRSSGGPIKAFWQTAAGSGRLGALSRRYKDAEAGEDCESPSESDSESDSEAQVMIINWKQVEAFPSLSLRCRRT